RPRARRLRAVGAEGRRGRLHRVPRHDVDEGPARRRRTGDLSLAPLQGRAVRRRLDHGGPQGGVQLSRRPRAQSLRARRQDGVLARFVSVEEAAPPAAEAGRATGAPSPQSHSVVRLQAHSDAPAFLAAAAPVLAADEARHNLMYGICSTLVDVPEAYPTAHLWTV